MQNRSKGFNALKIILIVLLILVLLAGGGFLGLASREYKPEDIEGLAAYGTQSKDIKVGDEVNVLSWNIGYAGLGKDEDFFMDGGKGVRPKSKDEVTTNLSAIESFIIETNPDVIFLQEIDSDCGRTYHIDEAKEIEDLTSDYVHSYANNYVAPFVPYPLPPLGKITSGIQTVSRYGISEAWRYQLPIPFSWPVRAFNLKRCLMIDRVPIADSDKELVLVNLHLEAYDSGEGKIAQTKMLLETLEKEYEAGNYVIAGGDFNQTFSTIDLTKYPLLKEEYWAPGIIEESDFPDHWHLLMDENEPSCRSLDQPYILGSTSEEFQFYVIDGFIVSDNLEVEDFGVTNLDFEHSDHNPVLLKVKLK